MKRRLPRGSGLVTEINAGRMPYRVVTADGRLLAGCATEDGAKRVAATINQGRAEPVRVVARGTR